MMKKSNFPIDAQTTNSLSIIIVIVGVYTPTYTGALTGVLVLSFVCLFGFSFDILLLMSLFFFFSF